MDMHTNKYFVLISFLLAWLWYSNGANDWLMYKGKSVEPSFSTLVVVTAKSKASSMIADEDAVHFTIQPGSAHA